MPPPPPPRVRERTRVKLIGGIPLSSRFVQQDPLRSISTLLRDGLGPADHTAFLPGKLSNADLLAQTIQMRHLARDTLRSRGKPYPVRRSRECIAQSGPVVQEFEEQILPESSVLLKQQPLPTVVAHKPFDTAANAPVSIDRLKSLEHILVPVPLLLNDVAALAGRPLRLKPLTSSLADIAYELKRLRPSRSDLGAVVDRAASALHELHAAGVATRMRTSSMSGIREESSSFGRFFTLPSVLARVADQLKPLLRTDRDVFIDFSCGTNEFGFMLGLKNWWGYDIYPPAVHKCASQEHFRWKNFFDVDSGELPANCVIGLNPPFGVGGDTASLFVKKAMDFRPRLIALIVPESTPIVRRMQQESAQWIIGARECLLRISSRGSGEPTEDMHASALRQTRPPPSGYVLVIFDQNVTRGGSFYRPGSKLHADMARRLAHEAARGGGPLAGKRARESTDETAAARSLDIVSPGDAPSFFVFQRSDDLRLVPSVQRTGYGSAAERPGLGSTISSFPVGAPRRR